jgi:TP901 family phage tail tape measure protein
MARKTFIGNAFITITGDKKGLDAVLSQIRGPMEKLGKELQQIGFKMMALGAAIQAPLVAATRQFAKVGSEAAHAAERTGTLVNEFTELTHAAKLTGAGPEALEKALLAMERGLGGGKAKKALADIGLTPAGLKGKSVVEQFETLADKIAGIEDPSRRAWVAMQLFGKGGAALLPMLSLGREGIEGYRAEARRLGVSIGPEMAGNAERLDKMLERLQDAFKGLMLTVGDILAPAFTKVTTYFVNLVANLREYLANNPQVVMGIQQVAIALTAVGAALVGLGTASRVLSYLVSPGGVLLALAGVLVYISGALDPLIETWGAAIMGFEIGGKTISSWLALIGESFGLLWDTFRSSLGRLMPVLQGFASLFVQTFGSMWAAVKAGFLEGLNFILWKLGEMLVAIGDGFAKASEEAKNPLMKLELKGLAAMGYGGSQAVFKAAGGVGSAMAEARSNQMEERERTAEMARSFAALVGSNLEGQGWIWGDAFRTLGDKWAAALGPLMGSIFGEEGKPGGVQSFLDIFKGLGRPFKDFESPKLGLTPERPMQVALAASGTFSGAGAAFMAAGKGGGVLDVLKEQLAVQREMRDEIRDQNQGYGGEE